MKLSLKQIFASAAGATLAAVIASMFGVKGTMIGVAIGSAAATVTTALVAQSLERGHKAVKQVVVQAPRSGDLLRRLGQTQAAGQVNPAPGDEPTVTVGSDELEVSASGATEATVPLGTTETQPTAQGRDPVVPRTLEAPTEAEPMARAGAASSDRSGLVFSWPVLLRTIGAVFVLALLAVTCIELLAGKPLSTLVGSDPNGVGTSVGQTISPGAASTTTSTTGPTTTTSTTGSSTAGSSTTTTGSPTTSTTGSSATTTSTAPPSSSTTTTSSSTTTTTSSTPVTSPSAPGG
jgi:hypothetical protein